MAVEEAKSSMPTTSVPASDTPVLPARPPADELLAASASPLDKRASQSDTAKQDTDAPSARSGLSMAAYLRSAMVWGSGRHEIPEPTPALAQPQEAQDKSNESHPEEPKLVALSDQAEVEPEDDARSSTKTDSPESSEVEEKLSENKQYDVTYYCLPDINSTNEDEDETPSLVFDSHHDLISELSHRPLQYVDVLLQADAHGIGLNVGVRKRGESRHGSSGSVLVVESFRRLHPDDVGPAEASEKIQVGDILHAVDGERVCSLQQLHAVAAIRASHRKFVLLRLLRPKPLLEDETNGASSVDYDQLKLEEELPDDSPKLKCLGLESLLLENPEAAAFVRELATTNRVLQDQLVASKLKQEEQRIQLDQLHALYARTQAESVPLFSFSKSIRPFTRRPGNPNSDGTSTGKPLPSRIHTEVTEAVEAEYARLSQQFELQLQLDRRELEKKYADQANTLREATSKKLDMMEAGFQQALQHYVDGHHCCHQCHAICAPHHLREEDPKGYGGTIDERVKRCSAASLLGVSKADSPGGVEPSDGFNNLAQEKLQQIAAVLERYKEVRNAHRAKWQLDFNKSWTGNKKKGTSVSAESK